MTQFIALKNGEGQNLDSNRIATDFVFNNNTNYERYYPNQDRNARQIISGMRPGLSLDQQLHQLHELRARYRGERNWEMAAAVADAQAYFQIRSQVRSEQAAGNHRMEAPDYSNIRSIAHDRGLNLELAENRRERAETRDQANARENARRAARTPEIRAIEEITTSDNRSDVMSVLNSAYNAAGIRPGEGRNTINGLEAARTHLLNQRSSGFARIISLGYAGADVEAALQVLDRQEAILENRAAPAVMLPVRGRQPTSPDAAASTTEAPATESRQLNSSEIRSLRRRAIAEISPGNNAEIDASILATVEGMRRRAMEGDNRASFTEVEQLLTQARDTARTNNQANEVTGYDLAIAAVRRERELTNEARRQPAAGAPEGDAADAQANGRRIPQRLYPNGTRPAPSAAELPQIDESQVQELQRRLNAAGFSVGASGADGKYGPDTHEAFKRFAQANDINLTDVDFTQQDAQGVPTQPLAARFMQLLNAAITARGGQAPTGERPAPAGGDRPAPTGGESPTAGGQTLTAAGQRLLAAVAQHASVSDAVMNLRTVQASEGASEADRTAAENLRTTSSMPQETAMIRDRLLRTGIAGRYQLNETQSGSLNFVQNGEGLEVHSDFIRSVETLLNSLSSTDQDMAVDGKWDARLGAILGQEGMVQIVQAALSDPTSVGSPAATPGQTGGPANGR